MIDEVDKHTKLTKYSRDPPYQGSISYGRCAVTSSPLPV